MPGQEGLGKLYNVVPTAAGVGLRLRDYSAVTFVVHAVTVAAQVTITCAPTFAGTYVAPTSSGGIISHFYASTSAAGAAAWTKTVQTAANTAPATTVGIGSIIAVEILGVMLPDPNAYVKCAVTTGTALVMAVLHDVTVARAPANLALVGA